MEDLLINLGITLILSAIKNPAKKDALKRAMLKVRNAINAAYVDDPAFQ